MSKMGTDIVLFHRCHGAKYPLLAIELGLVGHGHNGGYELPRYQNTFSHFLQVEELAFVEGQLGVSEFVSCRRAADGDLVNVRGAWVFSKYCCPQCCGSQILALVMSVYLMVCAFQARGVRVF